MITALTMIEDMNMPTCECGCGTDVDGTFASGHDQRLRADLETRIGGLLRLRELVDSAEAYARGEITEEENNRSILRIFWARDE